MKGIKKYPLTIKLENQLYIIEILIEKNVIFKDKNAKELLSISKRRMPHWYR